jgi:DNA-binding IclR family transcriptional regulator
MLLVEATPTERVAAVTFLLTKGDALTSAEIAERVDLTPHGARALLNRMSRVVPLYRDEHGCWRIAPDSEVTISMY